MIIAHGYTAEQAWAPFQLASQEHTFEGFWDAGENPYQDFRVSILDCLKGLEKGLSLGWYTNSSFNYKEYEKNYRLENGDMNWIIPGKILAFSSPSDYGVDNGLPGKFFLPLFDKMKVKAIIRLNEQMYEDLTFKNHGTKSYLILYLHYSIERSQSIFNTIKNHGINVHDLEFLDGSNPDDQTIQTFINIINQETKFGGAVAVHCRAGLGRTGTLIGCYMMNKYAFEPKALISWIRLCRPGSIIGQQQMFMNDAYYRMRMLKTVVSHNNNGQENNSSHAHTFSVRKSSQQPMQQMINPNVNLKSLKCNLKIQNFLSPQQNRNNNPLSANKTNSYLLGQSQIQEAYQSAQTSKQQQTLPKQGHHQQYASLVRTGRSSQGDQLMFNRKRLSNYLNLMDQVIGKENNNQAEKVEKLASNTTSYAKERSSHRPAQCYGQIPGGQMSQNLNFQPQQFSLVNQRFLLYGNCYWGLSQPNSFQIFTPSFIL